MLIDYLHSKYHRELEEGWGALEIRNLAKAEQHFQHVLQSEDDPDMALADCIDAHNGAAAVARAHNDFFDASRLYREAEYLLQKRYGGAVPLHLSWSDPEERVALRTLIGLAHTAFSGHNTTAAKKYYQMVLERDPGDHLGMNRYLKALENDETFPE